MELRLRRDLAGNRVFPAIDVLSSSTRREDLLLAPGDSAVIGTHRTHRQLAPGSAVLLGNRGLAMAGAVAPNRSL